MIIVVGNFLIYNYAESDIPMVTSLDIVPFPRRFVPNAVMLMFEKGEHIEDDTSKTCSQILCTQLDAAIVVELQMSPDRASVYVIV